MRSENLKTVGAVLAGLMLASLPYLRYATGAGHQAAHTDHAPRLGGQLAMVGEHHLELVRRGGRVHVYASDARRRPVAAENGTVSFDGGESVVMRRERFSLSASEAADAEEVTCRVRLSDGTTLESTFLLAAAPARP